MAIDVILESFVGLFFELYDISVLVVTIFFTPLKDVIGSLGGSFFGDILERVVEFGFGDISLASLTLGVGLTTYIVYQFAIWILDIIF